VIKTLLPFTPKGPKATSEEALGVAAQNRSFSAEGAETGLFRLTCQRAQHFASILKARHGLSDLRALSTAFRSDPGVEVHPERLQYSQDGFSLVSQSRPTAFVQKGWLVMERHEDGGSQAAYSRIRAFESFEGALAEFCTKLEVAPVGALQVAEGPAAPGRARFRFEAQGCSLTLISMNQ
jgi:hypothetical protein